MIIFKCPSVLPIFKKYTDSSVNLNKFAVKKIKSNTKFYEFETWVLVKETKTAMLIKSITESFELFGKSVWIPKSGIQVAEPYDSCLYVADWVNLNNYKNL